MADHDEAATSPTQDGHQPPVMDLGQHPDIDQFMAVAGTGRRQPMTGFDEDYVDIVDYIIRCTHKIWEERGIGRIYDHYRHNALIHTSDGMTYGRDKVIADSIQTMSAFPDIRLYGDDVIWSGNAEEGFHSSHRITWVGHNTGYSKYGPPTGRRVVRAGIAHCFVKENRVVEEWIARDEMALVRQLGFDEFELARRMAAREVAASGTSTLPQAVGEVERVRGQTTPPVPPEPEGEADVEGFVRRAFHEIWNWRLLNKIDDYYIANYWCLTPGHRVLHSLGAYRAYILALMASFTDLALSVDHVAVVEEGDGHYRVATRWTMQGTHNGYGVYGEPTGKRIQILGITHHLLQGGRFVRGWMLWDEFALLKQLLRPD
jgi:predicted ester cyclase